MSKILNTEFIIVTNTYVPTLPKSPGNKRAESFWFETVVVVISLR